MNYVQSIGWLEGCKLVQLRVTPSGDGVRLQVGHRKVWLTLEQLEGYARLGRRTGPHWVRAVAVHLDAILLKARARLKSKEFLAIRHEHNMTDVRRRLAEHSQKLQDALADAKVYGLDIDALNVVEHLRNTVRLQICADVIEE